ncbi:MAG: CoA-binding protein [Pseudomonadota bacterium]
MDYSDDLLRDILTSVKTVACVGVSANPIRPSHYVARYLSLRGYRILPVNPGQAGKELFGEQVRADVTDIEDRVDMLDLFRRSEHVLPIVEAALESLPGLSVVWMQVGVTNEDARALAEDRGLTVIQDRCPKIEHQRLFGELRKAGFNTGIISSKLT